MKTLENRSICGHGSGAIVCGASTPSTEQEFQQGERRHLSTATAFYRLLKPRKKPGKQPRNGLSRIAAAAAAAAQRSKDPAWSHGLTGSRRNSCSLLTPCATAKPRSPQDRLLCRSRASRRGWPGFLAGLKHQDLLPRLAAAVLAEGRDTDGLEVHNYTPEANQVFINEGFPSFYLHYCLERKHTMLYLWYTCACSSTAALYTRPLPIDTVTDGRGLK